MSKRQDNWLEKGYTKEQIENHLRFERYKSKLSRERRNKNNLKNKDLIARIKSELLNKEFCSEDKKAKVLRISPTVDGQGFFYKVIKAFQDGSKGEFREFMFFEDYSLENFKEYLFF
jgi:ubiquitin